MEIRLSENALKVLERRYLKKDNAGKVIETPEEMFHRVARAVAQVDKQYAHSNSEAEKTEEEFFSMLTNLEFMPNTPTLVNANRELGQLSACFVIPVDDSMNSIFEAVKACALIHRTGGGTGMSFSRLRPKDSIVKTTGGLASGPVSFMKVFDAATQAVRQGGVRRGANMGILRVDHPDISEFITCKTLDREITNFNISVAITDDFMKKLEDGQDYELIDPHTKKVTGKLNAGEVFDLIVKQAHKNGEPGVVFIDRMNEFNPTPNFGAIESTNPCVAKGTLISTEEGLIKIEKVHNPYRVITRDGLRSVFWAGQTGKKEVFKVRTKAGYEIEATEDHKFFTNNGWKPLRELTKKDSLALQKEGLFGKTHTDKELVLAAGWLIGDGHISEKYKKIIFYFNKQEKIEALSLFKDYLDRLNGNKVNIKEYATEIQLRYSSRILKIFKDLGFKSIKAEEKSIPERLLTLDKDSTRYFLSALFSCDGSVQGNRNKGVSIRLASNSIKLLKQVQILLLQFKILCKIYENRRGAHWKMLPDSKRKPNKYFCRAQHELVISRESMFRFMQEIGFCIKSKNDKFEQVRPKETYRDNVNLCIEKIEKIGMTEVYDIKEPSTHSFSANGIIVHNCGEVPLLPYESCNLGSINLFKMVKKTDGKYQIDWERLKEVVRLGVHFLDNVIDANKYPLPEIEKNTKLTRKIGLGVMGWASLLVKLGIPYDSQEALTLAYRVMDFILEEAKKKSIELAEERGVFPGYKGSIWEKENTPLRNATLTTIAPTGSISIIAGPCSSGIEPLFAIVYYREVMDKDKLWEVDPVFEETAKERGFLSKELMEKIAQKSSLQEFKEIPEDVRRVFVTAHDISPEWHIKMQAAFQRFTHNSVSKTINFSHEATAEDIKQAYLLAYELGCKGITIYRDRSREEQVLYIGRTEHKSGENEQTTETEPGKISPRPRPEVITGTTTKVSTGCGNLYVTINVDEECRPFELFTQMGKAGGCAASQLEAIGRLVSLAFRSGIEVKSIIEQLRNIRCPSPSWEKGQRIFSCADAIARVIEKRLVFGAVAPVSVETAKVPMKHSHNDGPVNVLHGDIVGVCPDCGGALRHEEGCIKCLACGFSKC